MPSCEECHRAKKSCDRDERLGASCSRCTRLGIACVARVTRRRQAGSRKRPRSVPHDDNDNDTSRVEPSPLLDDNNHPSQRDASSPPQQQQQSVPSSEDGNLLHALLVKTPLAAASDAGSSPHKLHYGIRYLIHSWSSFALARRSFTLLERACHLAAKCHVPMDDVFCP